MCQSVNMDRKASPEKPPRPPDGPLRLKYFRTGPGLPTLAHQQEILRSVEAHQEWHDPPPRKKDPALAWRDRMLGGIHRGDEVWIAFPGAWGLNDDTILSGLELLTRFGGVLRIWGDDTPYTFAPDAERIAKLFRAIQEDERKRRTAPALEAQRRKRQLAMTRPELKAAWEKAVAMWPDPKYTAKEVREATGIPEATLYRKQRQGKLPQRNVAPFVGGPDKISRRGKR